MSGTASSRRARTRRASGSVLPEELVVWEILVRLPAKAILRCRAVCRSWLCRTSESGFLLAHHRRQPSLPVVTFRRSDSTVVDGALDKLDLRQSPARREPVLRFYNYDYYYPGFLIHGSCDGLLLLSVSDKDFYLCNPATRQSIALPRLAGVDGATLYPHTASGEYRVIYWKGMYTPARRVAYHVITVGSSAKSRRVEAMEPSAKRLVETGWLHMVDRSGVLLNGCLHWLLHSSTEKFLVVFDTVAESFRSMPSPITANSWPRPQLLLMDATLAIAWTDDSHTMMKLWVLQNYVTGIWTMKRRVILPVLEMWRIARNCRFSGTVVSEDGDVLLYCLRSFHCFTVTGRASW